MRHTAKSSFLIRDLTGCDPRQAHPGVIRVIPHISAAALVNAASSSHRKLAESIRLGEKAQAVRSAEGLSRASQDILDLPLGKIADSIGGYYHALFLNRQGPEASAEADNILTDVADHGPLLFRAKACVAMATSLRDAGDSKAALEVYTEAAQIAESCGHGGLHPIFVVAFQHALIKYDHGDFRGALADIEKLEPLASHVGLELPAVLHSYYNNLAAFLIADGRAAEATRFSEVLLSSPFRSAYPEWQRTCADLDRKTRSRPSSFVVIGKPFTGEPDAVTEGARELPESCGESLRRAEIAALLLVKVICQRHRRIQIRLFFGQFLRHLFLAARNCALSPRHFRAYLSPLRWSYLRLHPAYPRPPTV
jgi:hypothetical protein